LHIHKAGIYKNVKVVFLFENLTIYFSFFGLVFEHKEDV